MVVVREAVESDIPRILELYEQLVISTSKREQSRNTSLQDYQSIFTRLQQLPGYQLLVAEDEKEIIGAVVLLIVPNLSHQGLPWAVIENMIVDEEQRRQGIGKVLMEDAVERARQAGCYRVVLSSNKNRSEAHRFYQALGFEASAHGFRLYF